MEKNSPCKTLTKRVGIIGTGQYASAFAKRLLTAGYSVTLGSRHPGHPHPFLLGDKEEDFSVNDVKVTSVQDSVIENDVIIVAIHSDHFQSTFGEELAKFCRGKVVVDVSNRDGSSNKRTKMKPTSNAQVLASLVPDAKIVKAFNSISAYVMENDVTAGGTRVVGVASDDVTARATVCVIARDMGFEPREMGTLANAWRMEEAVLRAFPEWRLALVMTAVLFIFWLIFAVSRFYRVGGKLGWEQLPLKVLNKVFGASSLSLLALTYFPSSWAAVFQMVYGTKHRRFPAWLDAWLKARKQLGLLGYFLICFHVLTSTLILSPTYMTSWFPDNDVTVKISGNATQSLEILLPKSWMTWIGELSLLVGIAAFLLMSVLAMTSLPSVTSSLNWAEWRLLHSKLGYVMLTLAVTHVYVMGVPKWMKTGFPEVFFRVKFLSIVLPTVVVVCRLVLLLPCVHGYVMRIRSGWERNRPSASIDQSKV